MPPEKIRLSEDEKARLVKDLDEKIGEAEDFRESSKWSELKAMNWRQHLAEPKYAMKNDPWPGASNLYLPLTQSADFAVVANEYDAILANSPLVDTVVYEGENPEDIQNSDKLKIYYGEYFYNEVINLRSLGNQYILNNTVEGTSAIKVRMNTDERIRRRLVEREKSQIKTKTVFMPGFTQKIPEVQIKIVYEEEAILERVNDVANDICDMNSLYFAPGSYLPAGKPPVLEYPYCPYYYEVMSFTYDQLMERKRRGWEIPEDVEGFFEESEITEKAQEIRKKEGVSEEGSVSGLTVIEMYMRWPLPARYQSFLGKKPKQIKQDEADEEGYMEEIIVHYAPAAQAIMRIIPLWRAYPDGKRPHVMMQYHPIPGFIYGLGVPSKLRHLNAATNAQWNQAIDNGHLVNQPYGFYNPGSYGLLPELYNLRPGEMVPTPDPRGVQFPSFRSDAFNQMIQSNQILQTWAEKVSFISETQQGRSPTTPNAPRAAKALQIQVQQGQIAHTIQVSLHMQSFEELCRRNHQLKKKYSLDDEIFRVRNRETNRFKRDVIPGKAFSQDVDFRFVVNPDRAGMQQKAQIIHNITMQAFQLAMQFPQIAPLIRQATGEVYDSHGDKNFQKIWPETALQLFVPPPPPPAAPAPNGQPVPPDQQGAQPPGMAPAAPPPMVAPPGMPPMQQPPIGIEDMMGMPAPPEPELPEPIEPETEEELIGL